MIVPEVSPPSQRKLQRTGSLGCRPPPSFLPLEFNGFDRTTKPRKFNEYDLLTTKNGSGLAAIMTGHEDSILTDWLREMKDSVRRSDLLKESELRAECSQFLQLIKEAIEAGGANFQSPAWEKARQMLNDVSRNRARQGFTPVETASFVFSAKRPLFTRIRQEYKNDVDSLASEMWAATELLDTMGLYTFEVYQKAREEVIRRQQEELLELSTPVVKLWEGVLALPIIGTLDSDAPRLSWNPFCRRSSRPIRE